MTLSLDLFPLCAKCKKPVEKMEAEQDFATLQTYFVAHCHGEKEVCALPKSFFMENSVSRGSAFNNKQIESTKNNLLEEAPIQSKPHCNECGGDYPGSCYRCD